MDRLGSAGGARVAGSGGDQPPRQRRITFLAPALAREDRDERRESEHEAHDRPNEDCHDGDRQHEEGRRGGHDGAEPIDLDVAGVMDQPDAAPGEAGEDEVKRAQGELDKLTSSYVDKVDDHLKVKEAELLEV